MTRIAVIGTSGAGKTTFARRLGAALDLPVVELDSLFHLPGWNQRPVEEFRSLVAEASCRDAWVIDGNYSAVRDLVWSRAQVVVWLDYPRWRVMTRVIRRTLRRVVTREVLWSGLREPLSNLTRLDPQKSIISWAWTTYTDRRRRYSEMIVDPSWSHIRFYRIGHPSEEASLLERSAFE